MLYSLRSSGMLLVKNQVLLASQGRGSAAVRMRSNCNGWHCDKQNQTTRTHRSVFLMLSFCIYNVGIRI